MFKAKRRIFILTVTLVSLFCSGCSSEQAIATFDQQTKDEQAMAYQVFTTEDYQNGAVPLNELVEIKGEITTTDNADGSSVKKNDRFILLSDGERYQIINQTEEELVVSDKVTVLGEYYGFIQAYTIKKE